MKKQATMARLQGGPFVEGAKDTHLEAEAPTEVPEWLAREAYEEYARLYGEPGDSFEHHQARGGFGPRELVDLLAGGTGDGEVLRRLRAGRGRPPSAARQSALTFAMSFAGEATRDPQRQEALALLILRAASYFNHQGYRQKDIERATMALTEKKT